jgi:hypothetical protein
MWVRPPRRLRIVGLFYEIDEPTTTMAEGRRMTAAQLADKLLASQPQPADASRRAPA